MSYYLKNKGVYVCICLLLRTSLELLEKITFWEIFRCVTCKKWESVKILTWGDFASQETFGNAWRHF